MLDGGGGSGGGGGVLIAVASSSRLSCSVTAGSAIAADLKPVMRHKIGHVHHSSRRDAAGGACSPSTFSSMGAMADSCDEVAAAAATTTLGCGGVVVAQRSLAPVCSMKARSAGAEEEKQFLREVHSTATPTTSTAIACAGGSSGCGGGGGGVGGSMSGGGGKFSKDREIFQLASDDVPCCCSSPTATSAAVAAGKELPPAMRLKSGKSAGVGEELYRSASPSPSPSPLMSHELVLGRGPPLPMLGGSSSSSAAAATTGGHSIIGNTLRSSSPPPDLVDARTSRSTSSTNRQHTLQLLDAGEAAALRRPPSKSMSPTRTRAAAHSLGLPHADGNYNGAGGSSSNSGGKLRRGSMEPLPPVGVSVTGKGARGNAISLADVQPV